MAMYIAIPKSSHAIVEVATGTAIKTLLQVATPSTTDIRGVGWGLSFDGISATAAPGVITFIDVDVAASVTSLTPEEWESDDSPVSLCAPTYTGRVAVGGVWPGFDDSGAPWGQNRYMWRRCGQTWRDTWQLANQFNPPYVMIATWNDFEEGSDIEFGIGDCLIQAQPRRTLPGHTIVYTHVLTNTGKFADTYLH